MDVVAHLYILSHLATLSGPDRKLKDLSIKVDTVSALATELENYPGFDLEEYRDKGFNHIGQDGLFLSKSLRDFMFNVNPNPKAEGTVVWLIFYKPEEDSNGQKGSESKIDYSKAEKDIDAVVQHHLENVHRNRRSIKTA